MKRYICLAYHCKNVVWFPNRALLIRALTLLVKVQGPNVGPPDSPSRAWAQGSPCRADAQGSFSFLFPWFPQPLSGSSPYNMNPFRKAKAISRHLQDEHNFWLLHSKALIEIYNLYSIGFVKPYHIGQKIKNIYIYMRMYKIYIHVYMQSTHTMCMLYIKHPSYVHQPTNDYTYTSTYICIYCI